MDLELFLLAGFPTASSSPSFTPHAASSCTEPACWFPVQTARALTGEQGMMNELPKSTESLIITARAKLIYKHLNSFKTCLICTTSLTTHCIHPKIQHPASPAYLFYISSKISAASPSFAVHCTVFLCSERKTRQRCSGDAAPTLPCQ